jgi:dTDP-glucose 4,6-dehydratase
MKYKTDWYQSKVIYFPLPINDPLQRQPDITKARTIRWEAKVSRAEGMKVTYDYFRSMSKEELSKKKNIKTFRSI